jgi:hypothetical protein
MTKGKLEELRKRMVNHTVINDTAVVLLTAKELEDLLYLAECGLDNVDDVVLDRNERG